MFTSILIGFFLGLAGSILNHWLAVRFFKRLDTKAHSKKKKVTGGFLFRQLINIFILFLVRKDMWMLIAAAIGLTTVKNYLLIYYSLGRKGVR
jgi:peptidoglycan biosynthesis protein MviN/MurJ (putative lipid II flippase)